MSAHRGFLCAAESLGYAGDSGNLTDYRYFSSPQSVKGDGWVTGLDKGEAQWDAGDSDCSSCPDLGSGCWQNQGMHVQADKHVPGNSQKDLLMLLASTFT